MSEIFIIKGTVNNENFMVPLFEAIDPDKGFNSVAADEWMNGPNNICEYDLSEYGLYEDCHNYTIAASP